MTKLNDELDFSSKSHLNYFTVTGLMFEDSKLKNIDLSLKLDSFKRTDSLTLSGVVGLNDSVYW